MTILVLEDDNYRFALIKRALPGQHVIRAEKAKDAIKLLQEQEFEYIMLDHDLAPEHYEMYRVEAFGGEALVSKEPSGMRVAEFIAEHKSKTKFVLVHSLNCKDGPNMVRLLMDAGYPTAWAPNCWGKHLDIVDEVIVPLIKSHGTRFGA